MSVDSITQGLQEDLRIWKEKHRAVEGYFSELEEEHQKTLTVNEDLRKEVLELKEKLNSHRGVEDVEAEYHNRLADMQGRLHRREEQVEFWKQKSSKEEKAREEAEKDHKQQSRKYAQQDADSKQLADANNRNQVTISRLNDEKKDLEGRLRSLQTKTERDADDFRDQIAALRGSMKRFDLEPLAYNPTILDPTHEFQDDPNIRGKRRVVEDLASELGLVIDGDHRGSEDSSSSDDEESDDGAEVQEAGQEQSHLHPHLDAPTTRIIHQYVAVPCEVVAHNPLRCWFAVDTNVITAIRIALYFIGNRWLGEYRILTGRLLPLATPRLATPIKDVEEGEPNNSTTSPTKQGSNKPIEPASHMGSARPNQSRQYSITVRENAISSVRLVPDGEYPIPDVSQMIPQFEAGSISSGKGNLPPGSDGNGSLFDQKHGGRQGEATIEPGELQGKAVVEPEAEAQPKPKQQKANDDDFVNVCFERVEGHAVHHSLWSQLTSPITPNTRMPPLKPTLFMFTLHLTFYYLVYIFILAMHEREAWKSANGLARVMIDELWLHQRKYGRGLAAEFLSETFTGGLERLVVGMASVLGVERQAWVMPG
ncbi:hypothetical protein BGZ60DRAFT_413958 [Tricladium varicosporioides]|nr:hypothetical protein BGZ60DRAFT_413958 [Hymenoscyphus varicosporioides]